MKKVAVNSEFYLVVGRKEVFALFIHLFRSAEDLEVHVGFGYKPMIVRLGSASVASTKDDTSSCRLRIVHVLG